MQKKHMMIISLQVDMELAGFLPCTPPPLSPLRRNHQKGNIITHASQGSEWHRLDKMHNPKTHNGAFANL